jgi:hypothetical protein
LLNHTHSAADIIAREIVDDLEAALEHSSKQSNQPSGFRVRPVLSMSKGPE